VSETSTGCLAAVAVCGVASAACLVAMLFGPVPPARTSPTAPPAAPSHTTPSEPPLHVVLDMAEEDARRFAGNCRGCKVDLVGLDLAIHAADCSPAAMNRLMRNLRGISALHSVECTSPRHHRRVVLSPP